MLWIGILQFVGWEAALFAASMVLARWSGFGGARRVEEKILATLAIEITLESTLAAAFSFAGINGAGAYWTAAVLCASVAASPRGREALRGGWSDLRKLEITRYPRMAALGAALVTPLVFLSFRPVEEADSINYLHYLIDWMANRATPYTFATNYVAFWELSFLPAWTLTRVDFFFPLLELKAVVLLALAVWLLGREFGLRGRLLGASVFGIVAMRYLWWQNSGVPTLKNDVLHGAGFVLLVLAVVRAAPRVFTAGSARCRTRHAGAARRSACATFAFGGAFAAVKYTGIFAAGLAGIIVLLYGWRRMRLWPLLAAGLFVVATSGHYYLHNFWLFGNPFYPFQINLGFLHLPGTADLSATSILYNWRNAGVWRALFLPAGGISSAGLLFPILLAVLPIAALRRGVPIGAAAMIFAGWLLYFRSVYSAGLAPGDIGLVAGLSTIRYVIGVLAASELLWIAMLARFPRVAWAAVLLNGASRLAMLYSKLPNAAFPILAVAAAAVGAGVLFLWIGRRGRMAFVTAAIGLAIAGPCIDAHNHRHWLDWWADLKPELTALRGPSLALLTYDDWGYFAGHVFAAGNPVDSRVRAIEGDQLDRMADAERPQFLAALPSPGSPEGTTWRTKHAAEFARWGYAVEATGESGAILERVLASEDLAPGGEVAAWYAPGGEVLLVGMPVLGGHVLRTGEVVADADGRLTRLEPRGRRPLAPSAEVRLRLANCGDLQFTPAFPRGRAVGVAYRWRDGRWIRDDEGTAPAGPLPSPAWNTSIGGGTFAQQVRNDGDGPFVRLRANNDARWLIYSAAYPDNLLDETPVSVRALVRCRKECALSTAGHSPELETSVESDRWVWIHLNYAYQKNGRPQHYAVGLNACHRGDWFDLRAFELRPGIFPYDGADFPVK